MARTELTGKQIKDRSVDLTVDVDGVLPVANGGTGSDTLPFGNVLLGNGTGAFQTVAPGASGHVLTSNGSTWVSAAPTGGGGAGDVTLDGQQTLTNKTISGASNTLSNIPQSAITDLVAALAARQVTSEKGQPGGYPSLDSGGKVPTSQLPVFGAVDSVNGHTGVIVLTASDIGLGNVDNTSDLAKPISTATQAALDGKSAVGHGHAISDVTGLSAALDGKEPTINAGTTGQYWRGDKSWQALDKSAVGLSNVDNTSDATKNSASATLTNKSISGADNALSNIPQSAVTGLTTDLAAKEAAANKGQAGGYASLDGGGKVPVSQLPNAIMTYNGLWSASANTPTLADGTGDPGDVYRVSTAGSRNLGSGAIDFQVGDYVIYNGTTWEKADTTDAVATVNGYTGNVVLGKSDVGLSNVDNTSDSTKNSASATLTNKTISGSNNTLTDIGISSLSTTGTPGASTYLRGDGTWSTISVSNATFADNAFALQDDGDTTKQVRFQLSGLTTGTTRTLTVPDKSSTIEVTANKGQPNGYASLDNTGIVPMSQIPPGAVIDGVMVNGDAFQLYSGTTPVGAPISLLVSVADGGTPSSTGETYIDGGTL